MRKDRAWDPAAWECLTDEQRDVIQDWWDSVNSRDKQEQEDKESYALTASWLALIPFAIAHAYKFWDNYPLWRFLLEAVAYMIVCGIIYLVSKQLFMHMYRRGEPKENKWNLVKASLGLAFAAMCVLTLIYN